MLWVYAFVSGNPRSAIPTCIALRLWVTFTHLLCVPSVAVSHSPLLGQAGEADLMKFQVLGTQTLAFPALCVCRSLRDGCSLHWLWCLLTCLPSQCLKKLPGNAKPAFANMSLYSAPNLQLTITTKDSHSSLLFALPASRWVSSILSLTHRSLPSGLQNITVF